MADASVPFRALMEHIGVPPHCHMGHAVLKALCHAGFLVPRPLRKGAFSNAIGEDAGQRRADSLGAEAAAQEKEYGKPSVMVASDLPSPATPRKRF